MALAPIVMLFVSFTSAYIVRQGLDNYDSAAKVYVGILAATILFIATNAGVIGASRITYAMATYRQLPEVFRRLHPRFKTPYVGTILTGLFVALRGEVGGLESVVLALAAGGAEVVLAEGVQRREPSRQEGATDTGQHIACTRRGQPRGCLVL